MKIVGLRIEKYLDQQCIGDYEYVTDEFERVVLSAVLTDNRMVEITLSEESGMCGSGYTTAQWGKIEVAYVNKFNYTHTPKTLLTVPDITPETVTEDVQNDAFNVSFDGGDNYYPSGGYYVNMDLFRKGPRAIDHRPVWIFRGPSGTGKTFIGAALDDEIEVYETDSASKLPDVITATVVIIGNRYDYNIGEVIHKLWGVQNTVYVVDFWKV